MEEGGGGEARHMLVVRDVDAIYEGTYPTLYYTLCSAQATYVYAEHVLLHGPFVST